MEPRVAVVVFPPAEAAAPAESFRRLHDPLFHKIAAHVAVVPAFSWCTEARAVPRILEAIRGSERAPFPLTLRGVGRTKTGVVYLPVVEGQEALAALHEILSWALRPPPGIERPPFVPVLGLGRAAGEAEAEFLQRQVAGHLAPIRFSVEVLTVVLEDARGLWHVRERLPLEAATVPPGG